MTDVTDTGNQLLQVRLDWSGAESAHALHVNQAVGQVGAQGSDELPDGVYLTMGIVPPPPLMDNDPGRDTLISRYKDEGIKVNVLGQYHMSRRMLGDLIDVLQTTAAKYDAAVEQGSTRRQEGGE